VPLTDELYITFCRVSRHRGLAKDLFLPHSELCDNGKSFLHTKRRYIECCINRKVPQAGFVIVFTTHGEISEANFDNSFSGLCHRVDCCQFAWRGVAQLFAVQKWSIDTVCGLRGAPPDTSISRSSRWVVVANQCNISHERRITTDLPTDRLADELVWFSPPVWCS